MDSTTRKTAAIDTWIAAVSKIKSDRLINNSQPEITDQPCFSSQYLHRYTS